MTETAVTRSISEKLKVFHSYRIDFFFVSLLLILSIFYFRGLLENDTVLIHGDNKYALTVDEHLYHHISNLPIHAPKLPLLSILYPLQSILGDVLAENVFTILTPFFSATLVYFANKQFVSRFEGKRGYWLSASCFVGSLVIMYNPWTINKIHHHYWLVLSLAASYLLIALIDSYLRSKERRNVNRFILIGFSASVMATQPQSAIIYFLPMLAIYLAVNLIFDRPKILSKLAVKKIALLAAVTLACNLFWLVPAIQSLTTDRASQSVGFLPQEISQGFATYAIVHENVDQLSEQSTIQNVLKGTSDFLWGIGDNTPDLSIKINNIDLWEGLAFLPLSFIFLFFLIRRPIGKGSIYIPVFFIALAILSVILATGSYYNDIYKRFFLDLPLGEALRDPSKLLGPYFVAVSFFASASLYRLDMKSLKKNLVLIILIASLIFSWGWVGLTGNLNGHLTHGHLNTQTLLPYPHDLSDVSEYLHREYGISSNAKGKIFWYSAGARAFQLQYSTVPQLSTESLPNLRLPPFQLNYIDHLIEKNDTSFIRLLEYLGVEYLVIREDFAEEKLRPESLPEVLMRVQNLKTMMHEDTVFESGRFGVYKLNPSSPFSVSHAISAGTDDLSKIVRVGEQSEYLNNMQLGPFLEDDSLIVVSDSLPPEPPGGTITTVDLTSEHYLPRKYWSPGAINGGWLNTITPHLNDFGINTWQFDYKGSIFTWGEKYVPSNYTLENAKSRTIFDFNSLEEISQWQSGQPKIQALEHESNAMRVSLNSSSPGWKTITSPAFDVSADRVYVAKLGIRYENAHGVHLKLTEYGRNGAALNSAVVGDIGTGTSDWQDISFSYRPSSKEVTSISLSIWHGHLTKQPLPNVLWIDSVGIYDISDQLIENNISVPFKVDGSNNKDYKLFVRYLESPQGGLINARLEDSSLKQISTLSPHSKFVWADLGEYTLNQGTHTMTFTNERGFNAINSIMLIQKDQFEAIKGQIQDWVNQNSTAAVYIFEGESDMYGNNTTFVGGESSSGNEMILVNNTAWKQFDVKKEGDYRIWIKGSGTFSVVIDDQEKMVNATMNRPATFSGSFSLKEGNSRLEITPLQELADNIRSSNASGNDINVIDSIWLVSDSNNNDRLHELLNNNNNNNNSGNVSLDQIQEIATTPISNNVWSSQKYEINLNDNSTKPLMISLAEPFDPNLKAAIYTKDGTLSKTENLIPLFYSLKSGIYLDSLAPNEKVVIYDASTRLQSFAVATFISLASYVLLILSANVSLTNRFKRLVYALNSLMKQRISQDRNNNNNNRGYKS